MRTMLAHALLLLVLGSMLSPARAEGIAASDVRIPQSSVKDPARIGTHAFTNHRILLRPAGGLGPGGGMTPAQVRSFYGMPSTGGQGVIAIVDAFDEATALADFNVFAARYGLAQETSANVTSSANTVFQVVYQGGSQPAGDTGWSQEEALDIEWAHAMAPSAKIVLVEAQSSSYDDLMAAVDLAAALPGVREVSMSWGGNEFSGETAFDSHFNVSGPLFFAASGDGGVGTLYPSVSPYVVSVGGTSMATDANGAFLGETGWRLSGGGISGVEQRPAWQNGVLGSLWGRGAPDISSDADPHTGVSVYAPDSLGIGSTWQVHGGTSVSSPCVAGMANVRGASYANTTALLTYLYSRLGTTDLRDIVSGNNGLPCFPGWDFVTGVGSPQGTLFGSGGGTPPAMTSPVPGSTLPGASVTFSWSAGTGATQYWLYVGTSVGAYDLYNQNEGVNLSATVGGLPTNGSTIYVRLWYLVGTWKYIDAQYTASNESVPTITSPAPGSTLTSTTVTFTWSTGNAVAQYWLQVGTSAGAHDLYNQSEGLNLSATVPGLPTNGSTVYVRLWYLTNGAWYYTDVTYRAW